MLRTIDRIQIATPNSQATAASWQSLLAAEWESTDFLRSLSAVRTRFRLGRSVVEFLEPDGAGLVSAALEKRGRAHLFAGGVSTSDFGAVVGRLRSAGVEHFVEKGQAFFNAAEVLGVDCPMVLSPFEDRLPVGRIDFLYEVTLLAPDADATVSRFAELFGLNDGHFVPIESERFGYRGTLTLFTSDDLHRFEVITPTNPDMTMGRFYVRTGPVFYMCFAETSHLLDIEMLARTARAEITVDRPEGRRSQQTPDEAWVHPPSLGGVMLGLSRPTMAWRWSGHPERVQEIV